MTATERKTPGHDAARIDFVLGACEFDGGLPIFELLANRNQLARYPATVTEAAVVEKEHGVPCLGKRQREFAEAALAGQTKPVSHHDAGRGPGRIVRCKEPSAADVVSAAQLNIGFSNGQVLRLGDLQRFIKPTSLADQHSKLN